jgi:hypothetical protein
MVGIRCIAGAYGGLDAWPDRPDYLDHELRTGRILVADRDGEVAAFGAITQRDGVVHLGDLFVRPDLVGERIGGRILEQLLPPAGTRSTFSSADPRALGLYARRGLSAVAPLVSVQGSALSTASLRLPKPLLESARVGRRVIDLDAAARGRSRPEDHAFLGSLDAVCLLLGRSAFAYLRTAGGSVHVGPAGAVDPADAAPSLLQAVAAAGSLSDDVRVAVPGVHPALGPLLAAGFRIIEIDTIMTSPPNLSTGRASSQT